MITRIQNLATNIRSEYRRLTGWNVKISFNDLSLEYGGILDYHSQWNCDHELHRVGKSADLNTTVCLTCDEGQQGCSNKSSLANITLKNKDGTSETLTVKAWIDRLARDERLNEWHRAGSSIHLELE